jgi:hypothetical protein
MMRRTLKAVLLAILAFVSALGLSITSVVTAPPGRAVTALIAPGTGTPDANVIAGYMENARDYYMTTTPCTAANDCDLVGVNYPASFWPLFFRPRWCVPGRCEKWDVSVSEGVNNYNSQLIDLLTNTDEEIVMFGYSQGGAIVSDELRLIAGIDPALKERLSVVLIGNIDNPLGGPWSLLGFLGTIPVVDVTTGMPTIVDTGIPMTSVHFEYDGTGDAPVYWGNPLAVLNALAGFWYVHGQMLWPNAYNETGLPNGYTPDELAEQMDPVLHPENFRYDSYGNPFITVPTRTLPIMEPFLRIAKTLRLTWLVQPLVDLVSPALRVIIDTAYDRDADPGVPRYLSPLPFNPKLKLSSVVKDFVAGVGEGVQNFLKDLGLPKKNTVELTRNTDLPTAATNPSAATPVPVPDATVSPLLSEPTPRGLTRGLTRAPKSAAQPRRVAPSSAEASTASSHKANRDQADRPGPRKATNSRSSRAAA